MIFKLSLNNHSCVERSFIKQQQLEGIILAKKKSIYKGRKSTLIEEKIREIDRLLDNKENKSEIARQLKISRETLCHYLRSKDLENVEKWANL